MKPGGVLLVLAGVWVLCQVLAGSALSRLGLEPAPAAEKDNGLGGVTKPPSKYHGLTDPWGRPL